MKRYYFILVYLICSLSIIGQSDERDSIKSTIPFSESFPDFSLGIHYNMPSILLKSDSYKEYRLDNLTLRNYNDYNFLNFPDRVQVLPVNYDRNLYNSYYLGSNHWIDTYRVNSHYVGLGGNYTIGGAYNYQVGDFLLLSAGMYGSKFAMNNVFMQDAGFTGNAQFILNERLRVNVFGQYSLMGNKNAIHAFVSDMYPHTGFGGSLEVKITDAFGIQVGYEREFDIITRRWINKPFIAPVFYGR